MCILFIHAKYTNVNLLYETVTATNFCVLCKFINSSLLHTREPCCGTNLHFTQLITVLREGFLYFVFRINAIRQTHVLTCTNTNSVIMGLISNIHSRSERITYHNFKTMTRKSSCNSSLVNSLCKTFSRSGYTKCSVDMLIISYLLKGEKT